MSPHGALSAVIITLNAERHLAQVLAALAFCDEIVILDSGSSDRTLALAQAAKASIHTQSFLGFGRQKQRAVELASNDWVLVIDADEVLDETARAAIIGLDRSDPTRAWRLRRRSYVGAREVRYGVWSPDRSLRLFHRGHARFHDVPVHESVIPGGVVSDLPGCLAHYSYRDYAEVFARMGSYSRAKAGIYRSRGRRSSPARLLLRVIWSFLRSYVVKRGFLDGNAGVVVALSLAVDSVVAMAMASEPEPAAEGSPDAAAGGAPLPAVHRAPGRTSP